MTFTEAAAEVLRLAGKPLHYKEITELAIEKNLLSHVGKSPEVTMGARLAALIKKDDDDNLILRIKPGVFGLSDWGKDGKKAPGGPPAEPTSSADMDVNALEVEAASKADEAASASHDDDDDEILAPVLSGEDALRADLAASGANLFDDEDDDDQPILAAPSASGASSPVLDTADGGRRRRRGRGGDFERASTPRLDGAPAPLDGESAPEGQPTRDPLAPPPRPMVRDRQQIMAGGAPTGIEIPLSDGDELAGRELADAIAIVLSSFERGGGPVPFRAVAEALMRRGRLSGDPLTASIQVAASTRADNTRRAAQGLRQRFRFGTGNRLAPTDWMLGPDLARLEQDAFAAVDRYREQARRSMLRKVQELPGNAFLELALLTLERIGLSQLRTVRRPGAPGGEAHFQGIHKAGGEEIRTAIVIRKDGREIGRERVSDLRGTLHHYGPAQAGWLMTAGQVLSGARDEAASIGAAPVALYDGLTFCRIMEDEDIGVVKTRVVIALPDLELFEALRGS